VLCLCVWGGGGAEGALCVWYWMGMGYVHVCSWGWAGHAVCTVISTKNGGWVGVGVCVSICEQGRVNP
jgi:hypothetical protein